MQRTGVASLMLLASPRLKKSARNITIGGMVLNPDFREFIQSLNDNGVRYLERISKMVNCGPNPGWERTNGSQR